MSKRKGLSVDEKRERMLEIFHESADVFVLKDIEKLSAKKGIISQTVKEVLQTLVDDDLVHQEKIGISNYFWSFPAEATVKIEAERKKAEADLASAKVLLEELGAKVEQAKQGKQSTQQRSDKMAAMRQLQLKLQKLQQELEQYKENDPETVEACRQATVVSKEAANRWLDNLWSMKSWCKKQFPNNEEELNKFFQEQGLTDSMEYVE
jgi:hypothetical protein